MSTKIKTITTKFRPIKPHLDLIHRIRYSNSREKIVNGRIRKRLKELALLEQPFIKNDKMVVNDCVKQTIATIGENIKVKRFVRFNLGEGLQKKSHDFVAEVAAQTAAKSPPLSVKTEVAAVVKEKPVVDAKEKEMEMQRDDLQSKPESIREKIVEGRVSKRLGELALLEQPFIKDDSDNNDS